MYIFKLNNKCITNSGGSSLRINGLGHTTFSMKVEKLDFIISSLAKRECIFALSFRKIS